MFHKYTLMINGVPHRFTEIEFYLNGGNHPDDFAHDDPLQKETGSFYFHKVGGKYKAGSFKGMDITFAKDGFFGGILIRGIQKLTPPRVIIDGPSLVVDHILKTCGASNVPEMVGMLSSLSTCDMNNLMHVAPTTKTGTRVIYSSARVGLTLKDFSRNREQYICRFYRFFSHPKDTKKGKPLMVLSLHVQGNSEHEIHLLTGSPKTSVAKYIDNYHQGVSKQFNYFYSKDLTTDDLCLLHGLLYGKNK